MPLGGSVKDMTLSWWSWKRCLVGIGEWIRWEVSGDKPMGTMPTALTGSFYSSGYDSMYSTWRKKCPWEDAGLRKNPKFIFLNLKLTEFVWIDRGRLYFSPIKLNGNISVETVTTWHTRVVAWNCVHKIRSLFLWAFNYLLMLSFEKL